MAPISYAAETESFHLRKCLDEVDDTPTRKLHQMSSMFSSIANILEKDKHELLEKYSSIVRMNTELVNQSQGLSTKQRELEETNDKLRETIRQREEDIKTLNECKERVERHIERTWTRNITDKITQASVWLAEKSQLSHRLTQTSEWVAENSKL